MSLLSLLLISLLFCLSIHAIPIVKDENNGLRICEAEPIIRYGYIENGGNTEGSTRIVKCLDGYELIGNTDTITCQPNGLWTQPPICESEMFQIVAETDDVITIIGDDNEYHDEIFVAEGSGDWYGSGVEPLKPKVAGSISCGDESVKDNTTIGHFYWPGDRCDGKYSCYNGADEMNCRSKCSGWRYNKAYEILDCRAYIPMFYYDFTTGECKQFIYGGCADVTNMFQSILECQHECHGFFMRETRLAAESSGDTSESKEDFVEDSMEEVPTNEVLDKEGNLVLAETPCEDDKSQWFKDSDRCDGRYLCTNGRDEVNCQSKCYELPYPATPRVRECMGRIPR